MRVFATNDNKQKHNEFKNGFTIEEILGEQKVLELKLKLTGMKYEKTKSTN